MTGIRVKVPTTAKRGEIIELKALIGHKMESGYRRDAKGEVIAKNIIELFECFYDGERVFFAEFKRGVAANPLLTFYARAETSGNIEFRWTEETGKVFSETAAITVS